MPEYLAPKILNRLTPIGIYTTGDGDGPEVVSVQFAVFLGGQLAPCEPMPFASLAAARYMCCGLGLRRLDRAPNDAPELIEVWL